MAKRSVKPAAVPALPSFSVVVQPPAVWALNLPAPVVLPAAEQAWKDRVAERKAEEAVAVPVVTEPELRMETIKEDLVIMAARPKPDPDAEVKAMEEQRAAAMQADLDFATSIRDCEKAHPKLPLANGRCNGLGLRYDHRYDNCLQLMHRQNGGSCQIYRDASGFPMPCPYLGGNQATCEIFEPFSTLSERPKGPGANPYAGRT